MLKINCLDGVLDGGHHEPPHPEVHPDVVHVSHEGVVGGHDPRRPLPLQIAPTVHPEHAIAQPGPAGPLGIQHLGHSLIP